MKIYFFCFRSKNNNIFQKIKKQVLETEKDEQKEIISKQPLNSLESSGSSVYMCTWPGQFSLLGQ